jgi:hypothetical protein
VTTEATTRDEASVWETWKSGRSPATPVSITATPMPSPVSSLPFQSFSANTEAV